MRSNAAPARGLPPLQMMHQAAMIAALAAAVLCLAAPAHGAAEFSPSIVLTTMREMREK
jgi:hypothetical protein